MQKNGGVKLPYIRYDIKYENPFYKCFLQIYPFSLFDTNADGYGDLKGISEKLSYIESLGVETIWLTPIYKSPMKDFGYDVSDYLEINPIFGTIEDFQAMVERAHQLGLKVIMDFVPNHSSDQHEWFLKSVAGLKFRKLLPLVK